MGGRNSWKFNDGCVVYYHPVTQSGNSASFWTYLNNYALEGHQQRATKTPFLVKTQVEQGSQLFLLCESVKTAIEIQLGVPVEYAYGDKLYLGASEQVYRNLEQMHRPVLARLSVSRVVWVNGKPRAKWVLEHVEPKDHCTTDCGACAKDSPKPFYKKKPVSRKRKALPRKLNFEEEEEGQLAADAQTVKMDDLGELAEFFRGGENTNAGEPSG